MALAAAALGTDMFPARTWHQLAPMTLGEQEYLEEPIKELGATFDIWVRISSQL